MLTATEIMLTTLTWLGVLVGLLEGLTVGIPVGEWLGETLNKEIGKRIVKIHAATDTDTHSGLRIWNARDRHEKF